MRNPVKLLPLGALRHLLPDPSTWDLFDLPPVDLPEGRWLDLPRRGRTWLTDVPGPTPDAPAIVLLHAVGCTGQLTWFPAIPALAQHYRVITFDQRWHGRGITSERFLISDCADDVAAVIDALGLDRPIIAGYSMGSVIAQRVWRQHPDVVGGLLLAATTAHFRTNGRERVFHTGMALGMGLTATLSRSRVVRRASAAAAEEIETGSSDTAGWALKQWRSSSPWAVGQAVASLGRHHSTLWLERVDVPTAVVVTTNDHVIPPDRQRDLAARIPGATIHEAACGHAGCVLEHRAFVPALLDAALTTSARMKKRQPA
ncbi:alpha/beta fold hydrolase [Aeromicrobium sp. Root236]|uniref:alpha/beta fold hydrolase n=1 Tax=Aeromicrobium sp. Root236 TaxID=1736498 RepID=UPI000A858B04|nr:alpha/beta fold hydrolase [Aeromicrobium sp. Root236]